MMEEKFANLEELIENIKRGGEVEFIYNGKHYSITHIGEENEHKISIMQAYNYDSEWILGFTELNRIGEFILDDMKLKSVISDCQIVFRCF